MTEVRVLLADDHPLFRSGLRALLGAEDGMTVVAEATSGAQAVELASTSAPDVVLMDLQMPGLSGIEATRRLVAEQPHVGVLMVTMYEDDHSVFAAMRAGAKGYVLKDTDEECMLDAIRAIARGEAIFSPSVARRVLAFFAGSSPGVPPRAFPELTAREREVLDLIARGFANPEITARLVISPRTVRNHISAIFAKLQVADRAQAIVRAREAGLG